MNSNENRIINKFATQLILDLSWSAFVSNLRKPNKSWNAQNVANKAWKCIKQSAFPAVASWSTTINSF